MPHGSINCNPKHWRERAEEARTVAESLADSECRRMMLQVADDYEKLANRAEERGRPVGLRSARTVGTLTAQPARDRRRFASPRNAAAVCRLNRSTDCPTSAWATSPRIALGS